jgi:predicted aspartyl protease
MDSEEVLLGMSFLKKLEMIQRGDQLTLRQHAGPDS